MDVAFYNVEDHRAGLAGFKAVPRRLLRRILRPVFFRLRDLLHSLHERHEEVRAQVDGSAKEARVLAAHLDGLTREVAALRESLAEVRRVVADLERRLLTDLSALDGRVAGTEDDLLRSLAGGAG